MGLMIGVVAVVSSAAVSSGAAVQSAAKGDTQSLTLGMVSEIQQSAIENHFRDFVGYVSQRLYPGAAAASKVVVAQTPFALANCWTAPRRFLSKRYQT